MPRRTGTLERQLARFRTTEITSAELKGPGQLLRIRQEIFDFEPDLCLKRRQTKPKIQGTVPTDRHTPIQNDYDPIPSCFDDDPTLLDCEIAQPNNLKGPRVHTRSVLFTRRAGGYREGSVNKSTVTRNMLHIEEMRSRFKR